MRPGDPVELRSMRSLPVVLLLCLCVGIAAAGILLGGSEPELLPNPDVAASPTAANEPTAHAVVDAAFGADGATTDADPAATESDTAGDDAQRTDAAPVLAAGEEVKIRVVRGNPPTPAADVEVSYITVPDGEARLRGKVLRQHCWPETMGARASTDAHGEVAIPAVKAVLLVSARSGDEFGYASLPPGRPAVTVRLQLDERLTLRTIDNAGAPAPGIPLLAFQQFGNDEAHTVWQGPTDDAGTVAVEHFQLLRGDQPGGKEPRPETFAVVPAIAFAQPVVVPFVGRPVGKEAVTIVVPPAGAMDVLVVDRSGIPILSPAAITGSCEPAPDVKDPIRLAAGHVMQRANKPVGKDTVRLPFFGLGTTIRLTARFENERRPASESVGGPAPNDGQRILHLGPQHVVVAGRIRIRDGTGVGAAHLAAALWRADRDVGRFTVHTIADGAFDIVTGPRNDGPFWLDVRHTIPPTEDGALPLQLGARVRIDRLVAGERNELGDVVLDVLPPLVSGVVVDDLGAPVGNADVRVQQEQRPANEQERPREPWRDLPHLTGRTAEDGTFVFHGAMPPGAIRVRADSDLHFADSLPLFSVGQQLRIVIVRNGIVRGRALLPDWLPDGTASLTLRPYDETTRDRDTRRIDLSRRRGGRFTVEPLRTGRYDAIVALRNLPEPVLVIPDVFVQPGEVDDARLREIDLRNAVFRYRLRAVDGRGIPVAVDGPILMHGRKTDGTVVDSTFRWREGRAEIVTGAGLVDFQFFGRRILPQALQLAAGDHDVYLQLLQPAIVQVPGARAMCGPTRRVRISVILTEPTGFPESLGGIDQRSGEQFTFARWDLGKSSGAWLTDHDVVQIPIMKSGKYEVVLRAHATDSERSPQASLSLGTFSLVADSPEPATVTVPLDTTALLEMLRNLDERSQQRPPNGNRR